MHLEAIAYCEEWIVLAGSDGHAEAVSATLHPLHQAQPPVEARSAGATVCPGAAQSRRRLGGCADCMRWLPHPEVFQVSASARFSSQSH